MKNLLYVVNYEISVIGGGTSAELTRFDGGKEYFLNESDMLHRVADLKSNSYKNVQIFVYEIAAIERLSMLEYHIQ